MLIGRDKETKQLIQAIENHDNTKLILIGAIAGMGKTTLVSHVLNHQQLKPKTIRIKLSQSSKSFPYQVFHEIATFIITQTTYTSVERDQIKLVLHDWSDLACSFLPNLFSQYSLDSSQIESSLISSREKKSGELVDFIAELTKLTLVALLFAYL